MKILTVIGARPQFIKAAAVSRVISKKVLEGYNIKEIIVHTGQHFDDQMSGVFFREMEIPYPDYQLGINGLSHAAMTGQMMEKIEAVLLQEKPDLVLVYGDTNTTLAGALSAVKVHIPVAHIEAGLRSFNFEMPEEINRIITDRISSILFCPTQQSVENLKREGYPNFLKKGTRQQIYLVGDVMFDTAIYYSNKIVDKGSIYSRFGIKPGRYNLCTIHRAENTDNPERLREILIGLGEISKDKALLLPLHPRTKKILEKDQDLLKICENIKIIDPVGYFDMLALLQGAFLILTDSGGLQKEAYFFKKYCITLRDETEWVELVESGVNVVVGADKNKIVEVYLDLKNKQFPITENLYGDGNAADKIVECLLDYA
ncbi:MAG: UDP-N-acetylglucosamine 2-epimerase (non-hydrolyzing) [Calditerrivibrio sp.]|nr:UDP-N-acetylglucosamine 2-epimerase (non-hydrolyzing) [Calditerrivibrio sp.]